MSAGPGMSAAAMLVHRELRRFIRQPVRIAAAVLTPLLLWALLGAGFAAEPPGGMPDGPNAAYEAGYAAFMLPGMLSLVTVFASVFASISLIEDRNEGWLRSVLVSPAPRWSIAVGKAVGGALTAWFQALLFLPFGLFIDARITLLSLLAAAASLLLVATAVSALSLIFAWRSATSASFHSVMNLVLMPMWLLSGALFPAAGAAGWMNTVMQINPLAWMTTLVREALIGEVTPLPLLISAVWTAFFIAAATITVAKSRMP